MFTKLVNYFMPARAAASVDELRSSKILVKFLLITGLLNLLYILNALSIGFWPMEYVLLFHGLSSFAIAWLFRLGLSRIACANLSMIIGFFSVFIAVWYGGGIESPSTIGVLLLPVTSLLLAGRKSGIFWLVVSVAGLFFVYWYESNVAELPVTYNVKNAAMNLYNSIAGIMIFLFVITLVFDIEKNNAVASVMQTNEALQATQTEIVGQRDRLTQTLTELKATQAQLISAEKMASLGELTAGIAHEIQNPLNFVNNFAEVNRDLIADLKAELEAGNKDEVLAIAADLEENEQRITYHGSRADAIVKSMLQHSRKATGQKEPTDINALCDEYLRLSYHGLRAKDKDFNATFKTDFDTAVVEINLVPQDIGRTLLNLFNNAFYAVHQKAATTGNGYEPTIWVSTKRSTNKVVLEIKDNGTGIPKSLTGKIFQPFFTTKPTGQGTGLGLSMAYDVITKTHGGTITVESVEGEGAAFIIQLPAA